MRAIAALLLLLPLFGQKAFEVASVKPNTSGDRYSRTNTHDTGLTMRNVSLKQCIQTAFEVKDYAFTGPDWLDSVRFDIEAKLPEGATQRDIRPMLRTLLADRFKLAVHRDPKVVPAYALVLAKGGPKMKEVDAGSGSTMNSHNNNLTATRATMQKLADFLARRLDRPVVDETGLKGAYDFKLEWSADEGETSAESHGPSVFSALPEQLGLRLQPKKLPVEVLVVDHAERVPTEN